MARVEKQLARLGQREEKLHAAMLASATDHEKVLGLNRELREVVDERDPDCHTSMARVELAAIQQEPDQDEGTRGGDDHAHDERWHRGPAEEPSRSETEGYQQQDPKDASDESHPL